MTGKCSHALELQEPMSTLVRNVPIGDSLEMSPKSPSDTPVVVGVVGAVEIA